MDFALCVSFVVATDLPLQLCMRMHVVNSIKQDRREVLLPAFFMRYVLEASVLTSLRSHDESLLLTANTLIFVLLQRAYETLYLNLHSQMACVVCLDIFVSFVRGLLMLHHFQST